jgi:uncharacterized protein (UPF0261 family)
MTSPIGVPRVVVLVTLDTKGEEAQLVADEISRQGCAPWIVDLGIAGEPAFAGDTPREAVAAAGGARLGRVEEAEKAANMAAMQRGATAIVAGMLADGSMAGVLGIGGGQGSWLASGVMRSLPLGCPKVLVTTAGSTAGQYTGNSDIMTVFSITDMAGLNRIVRPILVNAAAAVCGMVRDLLPRPEPSLPAIAQTMYGITTIGGVVAKRALEERGYEVLTFHANGVGGRTMEELIRRKVCDAVLDWSITELADELVGGICTAGPDRLTAAGALGLPQVVVPGGLDVVNFAERSSVPLRFEGRRFHMHTPSAALMRTSVDENAELGQIVAGKLNAAQGSVCVLIPTRGFSALSAPDRPFHDSAADEAFASTLRGLLDPSIEVLELPQNINEPAFAEAAAEAMLRLLDQPTDKP